MFNKILNIFNLNVHYCTPSVTAANTFSLHFLGARAAVANPVDSLRYE
jgi:hypothetical protein